MTKLGKPYTNSFSGKGIFPPQYAFTLLIPLRNVFLSPKKLIQRLDLQEDHTVLEIGPGPGYFSAAVARVLKKGTVVLLDIQQEMLDISMRRLEKRNMENVEYLLSDGHTLDLRSDHFDRVFMVTVIGEIENKNRYLMEVHRILKKDGICSVSELAGDPDKLSREELQALFSANGFEPCAIFGTKRNYTMNFKKIVE